MKIVYCSFDGRYSDNPRALYEGLRPSLTDTEHVWLAAPLHAHGFPPDATTVRIGSAACIDALETADLVVANTHLELEWVKAPGAAYLQTWHGTPLKRIHHDVLWAPPGMLDSLDRDVARWDYLVSPNAVSTPRLRDAFGFSGEVLEVGYPRNDVLCSPGRDLVRARVRAALGLADDVTAVLYAPTWRDDEFYLPGAPPASLALDVESLMSDLGPGHALLSRLHPKMSDRSRLPALGGVTDVSAYPDAHELYLAADLMITDYSSVMFDFAVTGKPLLFYTYDLEVYRDSIRGFYFDLEPIAPGPMVQTQQDLVAALRDLPAVTRAYSDAYAEFRATYCELEDGHATERLAPVFWRAATGAGHVGPDSSLSALALG
ncbi:MAG TPA: CDP-glycerol glycerophosphotransferase family protein [Propionibacteriaceae bacterium]